MGITLIVVVNA